MHWIFECITFIQLFLRTFAWPYDEALAAYNLNENKQTRNPAEYWGEWPNHTYHPSPENWRFPIYTLFLDRFVNGDPTNDNINGTLFEHDLNSNQMRHGGDVVGLLDTLDYLQGMGIKGIYLAGTILMNQPWGSDGYSALDTTLLDQHYGTIQTWREAITEIHKRGIYVIFDNTIATMGDLIGFEGYLNTTAPFLTKEHKVQWKSDRRYVDFNIGNDYNETCNYPRFWNETGYPVDSYVHDELGGCYNSDFDQYGDIEAFGVYPDWKRELAKFASVQDRLREWVPSVRERLVRHSCMIIASLDIDGFRYDKATQATVDALGDISEAYRTCARKVGKKNFFLPGEITGGNTFGSIFLGRGRQPDMLPQTLDEAFQLTSSSNASYFIRDKNKQAIDGAAFHYSVYRSLTRFLGMDGNLAAGYDIPVNWTTAWYQMILTNDLLNANTGKYDPRHMYGVTNQDVFRWPAVDMGIERQLLGLFITTLHLPGIPLLLWGEEQGFYILDATASNYIFGRQAMSPATAWKTHGCFNLTSQQYYNWPIKSGRLGCHDERATYDHRDPSHFLRNTIKHMYQMREDFPALNDGWWIQLLSNQTRNVYYPGSNGLPTETGMWSVLRSPYYKGQDLGSDGNQTIWLVYHNDKKAVTYHFDCASKDAALIAPFDANTTVKNLFYPHDEIDLKESSTYMHLNGSTTSNGCSDTLTLAPYEFKAYVPKEKFVAPRPMITRFTPGHDFPVLSKVKPGQLEELKIGLYFSTEMDCAKVSQAISFQSSTETGVSPSIDLTTVDCGKVVDEEILYSGQIPSTWAWTATLAGVDHGIHRMTIHNATSIDGRTTNAIDHFLIRIGTVDNPMIFTSANYSRTLLHEREDGSLYILQRAPGADKYRYSTNWGSSYSQWLPYNGGNQSIKEFPWSGTKDQQWGAKHVRVEYWSRLTGSSDYVQEGDSPDWSSRVPRRWPHLFFDGPFNQYGYDAGLTNVFEQDSEGLWKFRFAAEWPAQGQMNVWGINPDGKPDQSYIFGDADGDSVLDRLPPSSQSPTVINITKHPPDPYLAWTVHVNDATLRFYLLPAGSKYVQMALFILLGIVPVVTAVSCAYVFKTTFYRIRFNQIGVSEKKTLVSLNFLQNITPSTIRAAGLRGLLTRLTSNSRFLQSTSAFSSRSSNRRKVLIATMEYEIEDWAIKIKIGGLGVMAQLMSKQLGHLDLVWVIPCVGGITYPVDTQAESMSVTILENTFEVGVQYHILRNVTYVLLDAPVFRQQSAKEPYPARMDDLGSAIYYSAWNQCIAQTMRRFSIDLYHINDYHGAIAMLYQLPETVPICLSLHNAEFQGLWPMRTQKEKKEVCSVFNLDIDVVTRYVQFGEVFNLLHAGASYLRLHQQGFGAVGVSKKYGKRSYARYPIFWGLKRVGNLPNPDPSDTGEWIKSTSEEKNVKVDNDYETQRLELRRQAQEWAGLDQRADAELMVFVGRWSMQKGVDLIADVMPGVLESQPRVQLICVGPVIDLYGKFAALKLDQLMRLYPGRVCSKPQFTVLPPFIFSGAEFALIPSRDEPFGLVAVEFGRKGALGIGARVGGLGQMPGWWYEVESTTTSHLLKQFKLAIDSALSSKKETRAMMRARSAKQRFPVAQWIEDLEILQSTAVRIHDKEKSKSGHVNSNTTDNAIYGMMTPQTGGSSRSSASSTTLAPPPRSPRRPIALSSLRTTSVIYSRETGSILNRPKPGHGRHNSFGVIGGPQFARATTENPVTRDLRKDRLTEVQTVQQESPSEFQDDAENDMMATCFGDDEYPAPVDDTERGSIMYPPLDPTSSGAFLMKYGSSAPYSYQSLIPGYHTSSPSGSTTPSSIGTDDTLLPPSRVRVDFGNRFSQSSALSVETVVGDKKDYKLQKVDPFFTDSNEEYFREFEKKLQNLNGSNSEHQLCIEQFLEKSEKKWFDRFRDARLGRNQSQALLGQDIKARSHSSSRSINAEDSSSHEGGVPERKQPDEFSLGADYVPPTGLKKWMQMRLGDWPVYSLFLGLGQIIAANSYQITLLTGEIGQSEAKLYGIATVYLITSILWWLFFRFCKSVLVLTVPWFLYGTAFLIIGFAHFESDYFIRGWIQNIGSGIYAAASSSGSIFFALNFGDESGAPVKKWVFRACLIQGTQQAYVIALWYWGSTLTKASNAGLSGQANITNTWRMTAICAPITVFLWGVGLLIYFGLPNYYRQTPGKVPSFYKSVFRRKIVLWNWVVVILQNFFLSAPYGRNWNFLWISQHAKSWQILCLCVVFFGLVWILILLLLAWVSKSHSWILPIVACGLGAPRWAQIWWGTSGSGLFLPWAGNYVSGALVSRSLWLWLGVMDAVQGLGFGMILLQTLTRMHICFTLLVSQVIGSIATICARAFAPNKIGPGPISPDITAGGAALSNAWFWIALISQLLICGGFLLFFRREQLSKP
ncbi:Alpha-1,3-glucan synthase [Penicillium ucsense]|uniref:alpha-1,3-glucan synthase n=1 Tax=Penicillium ucsense TaxID=2839758 RepID=A0A8J8W216_9EURO|nr:Alpha-1,3-glucan synthase [Penicillium ucsense]KAF7736954.1 Alpha-1,3-glucan synthase [Penicillium ucsense]